MAIPQSRFIQQCRQIKIFASEIPVIVGLNKFKDVEDIFLKVWKRSNARKKYYEAKNRQQLDDRNGCSNVRFGQRNESMALDHYQHVCKTKVVSKGTNHKRLFQHDASRKLPLKVTISGNVDGVTDDGKIVEIKCRTRRFYSQIEHSHEIAQLQTYLWLCNKDEGQLVQYLPLSRTAQKLIVNDVTYDCNYWDKVIHPRVASFIKSYELFMKNTDIQEIFIKHPSKRKELLWSLYIASNNSSNSIGNDED